MPLKPLLMRLKQAVIKYSYLPPKHRLMCFKQYIIQFAKQYGDVELKGDPIILPNGAHLYFLGTNAKQPKVIMAIFTWMNILDS